MRVQAKDLKIGQMVLYGKRPSIVTYKSGNSSTIEVTYVRWVGDEPNVSDAREINFAEYVDTLDADFFLDDKCVFRTYETKSEDEPMSEAARSMEAARKADQARWEELCKKPDLKETPIGTPEPCSINTLVDIFNPNKNPFLKGTILPKELSPSSDFLEAMQKMAMQNKNPMNKFPWKGGPQDD